MARTLDLLRCTVPVFLRGAAPRPSRDSPMRAQPVAACEGFRAQFTAPVAVLWSFRETCQQVACTGDGGGRDWGHESPLVFPPPCTSSSDCNVLHTTRLPMLRGTQRCVWMRVQTPSGHSAHSRQCVMQPPHRHRPPCVCPSRPHDAQRCSTWQHTCAYPCTRARCMNARADQVASWGRARTCVCAQLKSCTHADLPHAPQSFPAHIQVHCTPPHSTSHTSTEFQGRELGRTCCARQRPARAHATSFSRGSIFQTHFWDVQHTPRERPCRETRGHVLKHANGCILARRRRVEGADWLHDPHLSLSRTFSPRRPSMQTSSMCAHAS